MIRVSAILALLCVLCPSALSAPPRNVLVLIADDLGNEVGCYGNPDARTPNIDRLASEGVRFSHGFAAVSSCSPSRSTIYTGQFVHTNGQYGLAHAAHHGRTHEGIQSIPSYLNEAGYRTGILGKLHVEPPSVYPFTDNLEHAGRDVSDYAARARKFFAECKDKPFFLAVGYIDPHRGGRGFDNHEDHPGVVPAVFDPAKLTVPGFLPDLPEVRADLADYHQSVNRLDQGIGMILKALEETGQAERTLVIFLSDNGLPFPGGKTDLYEPGIRLPLVVRSPAGAKKGMTNAAMVSWVDVLPTVLDWAGVKTPKGLPGRSFLPVLDQENPAGWDEIHASHIYHEITMVYPMRAVRTRTHKLIRNLAHELPVPVASDLTQGASWRAIWKRRLTELGPRTMDAYVHRPLEELYDLEKDPLETKNLAADPAAAAVLADLRKRMETWREETKDPWLDKERLDAEARR